MAVYIGDDLHQRARLAYSFTTSVSSKKVHLQKIIVLLLFASTCRCSSFSISALVLKFVVHLLHHDLRGQLFL